MGTTSKALSLLDFFTLQRPLMGLSELARLSGTNKATCFRLMSELVEHGLAEQVPTTKEYRIGPAVLRLAALREATVPTREAAMPLLQALAVETGETAHMSHLVAGRLVTLAFAYSSTHGMKVMMEDADVLPFHATSSGSAVLAFLPADQVDAILSQPLAAMTEATPQDVAQVRARIEAARLRGWAETENTYETDVASVAVPLFDAQGAVQGAVAVAAPAIRMTDDSRAAILRATITSARELITLWGGVLPPGLDALWRKAQA